MREEGRLVLSGSIGNKSKNESLLKIRNSEKVSPFVE
jgi:hypothetical protein